MIRNIVGTTSRGLSTTGARALGLILVALSSQLATAATISYGDFGPVPPGVMFLDVEESSGTDPVPLYGPPTTFTTGLDFNPKNFIATSNNGGVDFTDGQLNYTVMSEAPITLISLFERGDYSLSGTGTAATQVQAGAILLATVKEINGVPVAPINLLPVNASVGFNLPANPGTTQPWSLGLALNVGAQVAGATKIDVVINDALTAISQPLTNAFIAKKDFIIRTEVVPEPTTAILLLAGVGLGLAVFRRHG
jgi:hypothetical protein